jgi:hypothetical protein
MASGSVLFAVPDKTSPGTHTIQTTQPHDVSKDELSILLPIIGATRTFAAASVFL